ncbi:MAG: valyl-tRNA synthetase, valyl-tRNA synthetase [Candidatus Peregrinibacteria bacterium GW2011_GWF2_43_17]|nr:MAG: valyl-tRNA synthetase, valyl-tRNA synthetase [Candidatus Peregrinibacteria bacterium GW2011_GWF2_43_17]
MSRIYKIQQKGYFHAMIELAKTYTAQQYEDEIYKKWEKAKSFEPDMKSKKSSFTISMPPPNATGTLHLGHAIMLAIQDIMTRFKRMQGHPTLWLPGTDHAAIATQNKVEKVLSEKGLDRHTLGREKFIKEVKAFVADSQSTIRNQIRKMGSSCDWSRERYTLDKGLSQAVMEVFERMYNDGIIYRGHRLVNWCPRCGSTLADDEVSHKEERGKFYWIKYGPFVLATSRPETKLGDTAVAVNPKDKRYKEFIGKKFMIPGVLGEFEIKVVADESVDPKFGSGAVKVTPAHSFTDYEIAQKHKLPLKQIIDESGRMMKNCGKYAGMTTLEARSAIVADMEKMGLIDHIEQNYLHNLSVCYRCGTVIEPIPSKQWFIDVNKPIIKEDGKKKSLKEKSIEVVKNGSIKILPSRFNKTYYHWMENLKDWCISRQIWWGHRIPVWYCQGCEKIFVSADKPEKCPKCKGKKLKQDEDTLDTWFSSGLWTFSTLGWPKDTEDLKKFHPTSVMETGYDILFFWIARMILMTTYVLKDIPFKTVYLHGLVRTKTGEKMSKSKPETCIDPLDMIEKYGADALRLSLIVGSSPGNDIRLYEEKIAGYRNFINKIWNSARYVFMNIDKEDIKATIEDVLNSKLSRVDKWILTRLNEVTESVTKKLEKHALSDAGTEIYDFLWGEFCDWYLEMSKVNKNKKVLAYVFKQIIVILHPFVPFVTEAIWAHVDPSMLIKKEWPIPEKKLKFPKEKAEINIIKSIIAEIRTLRAGSNVDITKKVDAIIYAGKHEALIHEKSEIIKKLAHLEKLDIRKSGFKVENALSAVVKDIEIYLPLKGLIDMDKEKTKLKKEIENARGLVVSIEGKLKNTGFLKNAPKEVVEREKARKEEFIGKLEKLENRLNSLV